MTFETTETEAFELPMSSSDIERPALTIAHHPDSELIGLRAVIGPRGAILGRDASACLPGAFGVGKVSRKHAVVRADNGQLVVEDLQSRNGTRLNGERVERAAVNVGDVIGVGGVLVMVTYGPRSFAEPDHASIIGRSWPVAKLLDDIARAAAGPHTVTLVGETGTGKELVAGAIHEASDRTGDLVAVNCGALAEGVLESELFGHEKGSFTGAAGSRPGLVARAEAGSLFLDEITSTPPRLQTVMLRLLEDGTYRSVGGDRELRANVRVIAAAQPDIVDSTETGAFRPDLWFRISRRLIEIPSLDTRREDIPLLARHFARQVRPDAALSPTLALALMRAPWRGNVRELRNVAERIAEAASEPLLTDTDPVPTERATPNETQGKRVRLRRAKQERPARQTLERLLNEVDGRIPEAAARLGVHRKTMHRWIEAYGIGKR